jgi:hypothetical protein
LFICQIIARRNKDVNKKNKKFCIFLKKTRRKYTIGGWLPSGRKSAIIKPLKFGKNVYQMEEISHRIDAPLRMRSDSIRKIFASAKPDRAPRLAGASLEDRKKEGRAT